MQSHTTIVDESIILKIMKEVDIPGVAIALINPQGIIQTQELGFTDKSSINKVTSTTIFGAASLSKSVFSYLVLKLVQENILDLEKASLNSILPFEEFCDQFCRENNCEWNKTPTELARAKFLNVKMILSHTTGFDEFKGLINSQFDPGANYRYSGIPLIYLQKVIEKLTNSTLENLAKKYIFDPLKMKHSSFYPEYNLGLMSEKNREPGKIYLKSTKNGLVYEVLTEDSNIPWRNTIPWNQLPKNFPKNIMDIIDSKNEWLSTILMHASKARDIKPANAANSLHTTAEDYALFVRAWLTDEALQYAFKPVISMTKDKWANDVGVPLIDLENIACGLGWELEINNKGKKPIAYKTGDMNQWRAQVAIDLENKTAIVYFANAKNGHILSNEIFKHYIPFEHTPNYFSKKYGFAVEHEPNWQKMEDDRFNKIGKYLNSQHVSIEYPKHEPQSTYRIHKKIGSIPKQVDHTDKIQEIINIKIELEEKNKNIKKIRDETKNVNTERTGYNLHRSKK